jgi:hypothetical protein
VPYSDQKAWVGVATLSGLPATIAPIGHSESGLPIGAQIVGGYPEDRTTVAFARMIQREFGGFVPPPRVRHTVARCRGLVAARRLCRYFVWDCTSSRLLVA